jgi:cytoskeletal protein RodZ
MPTVAEQLRAAREAQGLTVYQVADATKIKTDHVRALDEGNFDAFSAPVFIRGFVRTYGTLLHLDVPALMADLDRELSGTERFAEPPPLTNESKGMVDWVTLQLSRINWRIALPLLVLGIGLLLLVVGYRAWRTAQSRDPLQKLPPGVYQSPNISSNSMLPVPGQGE